MRKLIPILTVILTFTIIHAKNTGDIYIKCKPEVKIYLDKKFVGVSSEEIEGYFLKNIPFGKHNLRLIENDIKDEYKFELKDTLVMIESKIFKKIPVDSNFTFPELIYSPKPKYPYVAKQSGYTGKVSIRALINVNGKVDSAEVFVSCGYPMLDTAAISTAYDFLYTPGYNKNNEPIPCWIMYNITFALD